jgi:hypothetical protein
VEPKRLPVQDAPLPHQLFEARFDEARLASTRLKEDLDAAAVYLLNYGPTPDLAPRLMACMLSASSVMGHLLKSAITLATNGPDRVEVGGPPPRPVG